VVPIVRQLPDGKRDFLLAKWGLIPFWAKDPGQISHPLNAKAGTAAIKRMFRHAFRKSRVLVPADAFYEFCHPGDSSHGRGGVCYPEGKNHATQT